MESREQERREKQSVADGVRKYHAMANEAIVGGEGASLGAARRLTRAWVGPLFAAIRQERAAIMRGRNGPGCALYGPALMLIDADRSALITITEMLNAAMRDADGAKIGTLAYRIGSAIIAEAEADIIEDNGVSLKTVIDKRLRKITACSIHAYARSSMANSLFNRKVCVALGARCISIAMAVCMADYEAKRPAFERCTIRKGARRIGAIRLTTTAIALIDEAHGVRSLMRPKHAAMIVPPRLWSEGIGGYLSLDVPMVGKTTPEQDKILCRDPLANQRVALDVASQQPWKINATVLAVAIELWKTSANIPGIGNPDVQMPTPKPTDERSLKAWKREAAAAIGRERVAAAERSKFLRRMSAAQDLIAHIFYMPHRLDWRGRMHPMPSDLNHHQGDFSRGLLLFADGGGEVDEAWFAMHCANTWGHGFQRKSFEERVEWTKKNRKRMLSVGRDPLEETWWHEADNPWQFLACCVGINRPEVAACIPVQLDHTANALQHIVALGLDDDAAELVNLSQSNKPVDPYEIVVKRIHRHICELAENGDAMATEALPHIVRSVLKRPLMTTVYRVSRHGAANQVKSALPKSVPMERRMKLARWISDQALDVMHDAFRNGMLVVDWIEESARACLKTDKHAILQWQSASGMPIIQPYRRFKRNVVRTAMQAITIVDTDSSAPSDRRRQMRGVFANFVQSLEASQMHGMAMAAGEDGLPFAGVHDSVWTTSEHAAQMHAIARQHFAGLHMSDPLTKLAEEWSTKYPGAAIRPLPKRGKLVVPDTANAHYMLS
jgi:DNA-directed RNA polymerase